MSQHRSRPIESQRGASSLPGTNSSSPTRTVEALSVPLPPGMARYRSPLSGAEYGGGSSLRRTNSLREMRSSDFAEKIRQLELEGTKLRNQVEGILEEVSTSNGTTTSNAKETTEDYTLDSRLKDTPYAHLVDISQEEKTLESLKSQLDFHGREASSLQQRIRTGSPKPPLPSASPLLHPPYPPPVSMPIGDKGGQKRTELFVPPAVMEKELRDAREYGECLKNQIRLAHDAHQRERSELVAENDDLKGRLYESRAALEAMSQQKEVEGRQQESVVAKLRASLDQLVEANRNQEQTLLETNRRLDSAHQNHYILDGALESMRGLLASVEHRLGAPFMDGEPCEGLPPTKLVHAMDKCLRELESELDRRSYKVRKLEQDMDEARRGCTREKEDLERDYHRRAADERDRTERELRTAQDRAQTAQRQADTFKSELTQLREALEQERKSSTACVQDLESRLDGTERCNQKEREEWGMKLRALETTLDVCQKEAAGLRSERDRAQKEMQLLEARLDATQAQLSEVEASLDEARSSRDCMDRSAVDAEKRVEEMQRELREAKTQAIKLEMSLKDLQEASAQQVEKALGTSEEKRPAKDDVLAQIQTLTSKLSETSLRLDKTERESSSRQSELTMSHDKLRHLSEKLSMTQLEVQSLKEEKARFNGTLDNRSADIERLTSERDYYFQCLDEKTEDLATLKAERLRLIAQLDETTSHLEQARAEGASVAAAAEAGGLNFREERLHWARQLEDTRQDREGLVKKLKNRDKRIKELETAKAKLTKELKMKGDELENYYVTRDNLTRELKEARTEVSSVCHEMQNNKLRKASSQPVLEKKVQDLADKLQLARQDLKIAQEALRAKEISDKKTLRMAGRVQEQVTAKRGQLDSVQTRIRTLEDKVFPLEKERDRLREENARLCKLLQRMCAQNEKLAEEFEYYLGRNQELRDRLAHSEEECEQAVCRQAALQQQVDTMEEEVTRARMRTQLEMRARGENRGGVMGGSRVMQSDDGGVGAVDARGNSRDLRVLGCQLRGVVGEMRQIVGDGEPRQSSTRSTERFYISHQQTGTAGVSGVRSGTNTGQANNNANTSSSSIGQSEAYRSSQAVRDNQRLQPPAPIQEEISPRSDGAGSLTEVDHHLSEREMDEDVNGDVRRRPAERGPREVTLNPRTGGAALSDNDHTGRSSPVEELLLTPVQSARGLSDETRRFLQTYDSFATPSERPAAKPESSVQRPDQSKRETEDMCRALEEKIDSLTRMGSDLKRENDEAKSLLDQRSEKIKKLSSDDS